LKTQWIKIAIHTSVSSNWHLKWKTAWNLRRKFWRLIPEHRNEENLCKSSPARGMIFPCHYSDARSVVQFVCYVTQDDLSNGAHRTTCQFCKRREMGHNSVFVSLLHVMAHQNRTTNNVLM
jgi:hypothetical protein